MTITMDHRPACEVLDHSAGNSMQVLDQLAEALRASSSALMLIDAANRKVPRQCATIAAARAESGRTGSGVATWAIELRAGLMAADIDLDGDAGWAATQALTNYLAHICVPFIVTASGRPGHFHVIARPGEVSEYAAG